MKKILSILFAVFLLSSVFTFNAFADDATATFSDDFKSVYMGGYEFKRCNTSLLVYEEDTGYFDEYDTYIEHIIPYKLTNKQKEVVEDVDISIDEDQVIMSIYIYYKDGSTLRAGFLRTDYINSYNALLDGKVEKYAVDFAYPDGNTVIVPKDALFTPTITLKQENSEYFCTYAVSDDGKLRIEKGFLIVIDTEYYYIDNEENDNHPRIYEFKEIKAHKITDSDVVEKIENAYNLYYDNEFGTIFGSEIEEEFSKVFLVFIFGVVPFGILIAALILAIRSKLIYRKLFKTIAIISGAEVLVFAIIVLIFNVIK